MPILIEILYVYSLLSYKVMRERTTCFPTAKSHSQPVGSFQSKLTTSSYNVYKLVSVANPALALTLLYHTTCELLEART